jgi:hypothetical protein
LAVASLKTPDIRDNLITQSLLWRSAELLMLDPRTEFGIVVAKIPETAGFFGQWLGRSPEDRAISLMGYRESANDDGFMFEDAWGHSAPNYWHEGSQGLIRSIFARFRK